MKNKQTIQKLPWESVLFLEPRLFVPLTAILLGASVSCLFVVWGGHWLSLLAADGLNTWALYADELFIAGSSLLYLLLSLSALRAHHGLREPPGMASYLATSSGAASFALLSAMWDWANFRWSEATVPSMMLILATGLLLAWIIKALPLPSAPTFSNQVAPPLKKIFSPNGVYHCQERSVQRAGLWLSLMGAASLAVCAHSSWYGLPGAVSLLCGLFLYFSVIVRGISRLRWLKRVKAGEVSGVVYASSTKVNEPPLLYLGEELRYGAEVLAVHSQGDGYRAADTAVLLARAPSDLNRVARAVRGRALVSLLLFPVLVVTAVLTSPSEPPPEPGAAMIDVDGDSDLDLVSTRGSGISIKLKSWTGWYSERVRLPLYSLDAYRENTMSFAGGSFQMKKVGSEMAPVMVLYGRMYQIKYQRRGFSFHLLD